MYSMAVPVDVKLVTAPEPQSALVPPVAPSQQLQPLGSQKQLYVRIAQLRDHAESIYWTTLHTAAMRLCGSFRSAAVELPELSSGDSSHAAPVLLDRM